MMRTRMNRVEEKALYAEPADHTLQLRSARLPLIPPSIPEQEGIQNSGFFYADVVDDLLLSLYAADRKMIKSQIDDHEPLFRILRMPSLAATAMDNQQITRPARILRSELRCDLRIAESEVRTRRIKHAKLAGVRLEPAVGRSHNRCVLDAIPIEVSSQHWEILHQLELRPELHGDKSLQISRRLLWRIVLRSSSNRNHQQRDACKT